MEVINTKPFEVVFTFVRHPHMGVLIEANAVQLLENGNPSLTFQRIREKTADYFGLNPEQKKVVEILEGLENEAIMKRFYKGTRKIKPADFFIKQFDEDTEKAVLDFVEVEFLKVIKEVKNYQMYWAGKTGEPMGMKIDFYNEPSTPLFHFRRDETGMNYFVTIKHRGEKVNFCDPDSELLIAQPAWLLTPNRLLFFGANVEGKKIKPFLRKKFIHIDPHQEATYMRKFVGPLLENHDVFAVGFDIVTDQLEVQPLLKLTSNWENPHLVLYMKYGNWVFPYHVNKKVNVRLEESENTYTFHRIKRLYSVEKQKIETLKELGLVQTNGSLFSLDSADLDAFDIVSWVNENRGALERAGFEIQQEDGSTQFYLGSIQLLVTVKNGIDWFDVHAIVKLEGFEIPFIKLRKNILEKRREYVLPNGKIVILPAEWFNQFAQIVNLADVHDESYRVRNIHVSLLADLDEYLNEVPPTSDWTEALHRGTIPTAEMPEDFKGELRNYQLEGYSWIRFMQQNRFGALLADDMGLGKTIQTLAHLQTLAIEYQKERELSQQLGLTANGSAMVVKEAETPVVAPADGKPLPPEAMHHGPILVIAPKSLLYNWMSESAKFCPTLKTCLYSGLSRQKLISTFGQIDLVVMSYGTMRNDIETLRNYRFNCIVLDESQAIKNPSSQTSRALLKLQSQSRIALTGTPIENTLLDIWSQMNFLNPGLLGSYTYFEKQFIKPIEKGANPQKTEELRKLIDPFVLRRTKKQVMKELPPKIEKVHFCEMSAEQADLYESVKNQYRNEILNHVTELGISKSRLKIFNGLMHLRQIALNPTLKDVNYEGGSGKDDEIMRMLLRAVANGHKVLFFSQFVGYLKVFEDMFEQQGVEYCYLDGSMDEKERQQQIDLFQNDDKKRVFLLSLRAGNSGLNLTAADYVFLADPWWNPFTMKQAEDRAHRIGQDKPVFSYKFITKDTIEEKILALQAKKAALAESVIPDEDSILASLNLEELEDLLN
ncbi:MAG: DEAD/DEAH box helicase [Bacteroidetes bacterium]|nr:DEAD/DEAH box helicase [Bacteroidota bacterium]